MKTCIDENLYNRFMEDTLSNEELRDLEAHLDGCEACRAEYEGWQVLKSALYSVVEIDVPKTLKSRVMKEIHETQILPAKPSMDIRRGIAAAVLLLLLMGYLFQPLLIPAASVLLKEGLFYLSEIFCSIIGFLGLDMKLVMSLFKAIIPLVNELFWMFAMGTFMLIIGFFLLILKGRAKLKSN